jgi:predicted Holliday junction resolvase-like endonuclease
MNMANVSVVPLLLVLAIVVLINGYLVLRLHAQIRMTRNVNAHLRRLEKELEKSTEAQTHPELNFTPSEREDLITVCYRARINATQRELRLVAKLAKFLNLQGDYPA